MIAFLIFLTILAVVALANRRARYRPPPQPTTMQDEFNELHRQIGLVGGAFAEAVAPVLREFATKLNDAFGRKP